jgi:hypothetical protein
VSQTQIEVLVEKVQALPDAVARETALRLAEAILDLHAAALQRTLDLLLEAEGGPAMIDALATDPQISSVLLLHDLHPLDLETRVTRALADPSFHTRGASAELVSIDNGTVRVRIEGGRALKSAVEQSLWEAAPDASGVVVEGASEEAQTAGFVPLEQLLAG